jgi:hypothetical protein
MYRILLFSCFLIVQNSLFGQGYWFGVKSGLAMNWQTWGDGVSSGLGRNQLLSVPLDIYIESYDEEKKGSFYAQLGYKTRGSSFRLLTNFGTTNTNQDFRFRNLVLEAGVARTLSYKFMDMTPFYKVGLRGEYTLSTNLDDFLVFNSLYYPVNDFVEKFPFGFTVGGGFNYDIEDLYGVLFEFTINPDIGLQYEQPPLNNIRDPFTNQPTFIGLRQFRNLSLEFKIGLRFLRKIEYID